MVFEGILVDVLNRFLGPYVKNLDASQLRVGIWGGDVLLNKLEVKENALANLDLPVCVYGGYLDKLRLKIPWKNLYSAPVTAEVDGLYVLVGPIAGTKYDANKVAKEEKEAKERQLKKIDEARKKASEKTAKEETDPGFVEKLVTQIIKNVKITVKNIHVCYEDAVSNPSRPFSCGVTLDSLFVQSTDGEYNIGETATDSKSLIYKLVEMSYLAVYWNSQTKLMGPDLPEDWVEAFTERIARPHKTSSGMQYVVHPISAQAKLQLSMKPGTNMDIPQALVSLVLREVTVALQKQQYRDIMSLIESFDRMSVNKKYLKYKPVSQVREDLDGWWRYAITAVLEEDVKRRTQMWSWKHIKQHREWCQTYTQLYTKKLLNDSLSKDDTKQLERLEEVLDVFNITICRQLAENEAHRERTVRKQKEAESGGGWWGWATSWVGGGGDEASSTEFTPPTEEELAEEKQKLYKSIGYSENAAVASYSDEYIAHKVQFELKKVSLMLSNENGSVAAVSTNTVKASLVHRPASKNIGVSTSVKSLQMWGKGEKDIAPVIISTKQQETDLLTVLYELKPMNSKVEHLVNVQLQPIELVYDADTVDAIIDMFLPPQDVKLKKLSATAASTLDELRTLTRAGLEHAINQRKLIDIDITLHSPYVVVPENGTMLNSPNVLLLDLGLLKMTTDMKFNVPSVREASRKELEAAFYDHFKLSLEDIHVIVAEAKDDWKAARTDASSNLHILQPTGVDLQLKKSLLPNDTKLPSIVVIGQLPNLTLKLSDHKIKQVLKLVQSLPLPPPSLAKQSDTPTYGNVLEEPVTLGTKDILHTLSTSGLERESPKEDSESEEEWYTAEEGQYSEELGTYIICDVGEGAFKDVTCEGKVESDGETDGQEGIVSATKLKMSFIIPKVGIHFSEHTNTTDDLRLALEITSVSTQVEQRTLELDVDASLGSLTITDYFMCDADTESEPSVLLETSAYEMERNEFLTVKFNKYDRTATQYTTMFGCVKQSVDIAISQVKLRLQRESLTNLVAVSKSIAYVLKKDEPSSPSEPLSLTNTGEVPKLMSTVSRIAESASKAGSETTPTTSTATMVRDIPGERDLHVKARLKGVQVTLLDCQSDLLVADVLGLESGVDMYKEKIVVTASISKMSLQDREPGSVHPNVIYQVDTSQKIITTTVEVYQNAPKEDLTVSELSVAASIQRLRITMPFRFINRVKEFATQFVTQLKLAQETIDSARKAVSDTAAMTAEALKDQSSSRVRLDVVILAPVVVIPLSATSQSALVADLGRLKVKNTFLHASSVAPLKGESGSIFYAGKEFSPRDFISSSGQKAIVDRMSVKLSSIQLGRVINLKEESVVPNLKDHVILNPLEFSGHVTRRLSSWCTVVPDVDVNAVLKAVEIQFSPDDFQAIMTVIDSLSDGQTLQPETPPQTPPISDESESEKDSDSETSEGTKTPSSFNIHVMAAIGVVKLLLHSQEGRLASVGIEELSTEVGLIGDEIQVNAGISDISVTDLSLETHYPKIISVVEGGKALSALVGVYPKATKSSEGFHDMSKCDLSIEASVGQLRITVLFLFVNRLLIYLKRFVSQDTIESAKRSAQEGASAAVSAVQEQHKSGQRFKLNIIIDAPEVFLPLRSDSREMIVLDLGYLKLSNTFHLVTRSSTNEQNQQAIYEEYAIELTELQVYRSLMVMGKAKEEETRRLILQPFNLSVLMKRNLSATWYREIPTIEMDAQLGDLKMLASGDDIESICNVLSGNLKEGIASSTEEEERETVEEEETETSEKEEPKKDKTDELTEESVSGDEAPFKMLNVTAQLKSIEIQLYLSENTDNGVLSKHRDPANALAKLTLHKFTAATSMESNGAMEVTAEMEKCLLDDTRPEKKGKISRLIERVLPESDVNEDSPPSSFSQSLIAFSFSKSESNESEVLATVDGIQILVDLKFILTLVNFVTTSIKPLMTKTETLELDREKSKTEISKTDSEDKTTQSSPSPRSQDTPSKVKVHARVLRPLIALLENADIPNSRALVLGTEVDAALVQVGSQMSLSTTVKGLYIASTSIDNLRNTSNLVLVPTKEAISATIDQLKGDNTFIDVIMPALAITLSPATVRLILHVVKSLQPDNKTEEKSTGPTVPFDLWAPKPVDKTRWYLSPPEIGTSVDFIPMTSSVDKGPTATKEDVELRLRMSQLNLLFEQELPNGKSSPVIAIAMGKYKSQALSASAQDSSTGLKATAEVSLEVSYYNMSTDAWEPLLEPVVDPKNEEEYRSWTLQAEVEKQPPLSDQLVSPVSPPPSATAGTTNTETNGLPPELSIKVVSKNALQLTVTKTSLALFKELLLAYQEEKEFIVEPLEEVDVMAPEAYDAFFLLKNELGRDHPLVVKTKDTLKLHRAYSSTVHSGKTVPLHPVGDVAPLKPGELLPRDIYLRRVHIISLQVAGFKPQNVALGVSESVYYPLSPVDKPDKQKGKDAPKIGIVVNINRNADRSAPLVTIRSPLKIVNHLKESVEVFWKETPQEELHPGSTPLVTLEGGKSATMPLNTTGKPGGGFVLQPKVPNARPSQQSLFWSDGKKTVDLDCYAVGRSVEGSIRCRAFFIHAQIAEEKYSKKPPIELTSRSHHIFHLHYPLVLQNLLPLPLSVVEDTGCTETRQLKPGEEAKYSHATLRGGPRFIFKLQYGDRQWEGEVTVNHKSSEFVEFKLKPLLDSDVDREDTDHGSDEGVKDENLSLMVHKEIKGTCHLSVYSRCWMVNKTGLTLQYTGKSSSSVVVTHPSNMALALYPNKEVRVRVVLDSGQEGEWSKALSLDAVGSEGVFQSVDSITQWEYQLGSKVEVSSEGLSKIITISPLFMAYNRTTDSISFREKDSSQEPTTVPPKTLVPFWPQRDSEWMSASVNEHTMSNTTQPFKFTDSSSLILRTYNEVPALIVDIQVTGSANIVTFSSYYEGCVPIQLVNDTEYTLEFKQDSKSVQASYPLLPHQSLMYTWDKPSELEMLSWSFSGQKKTIDLPKIEPKDGNGEFTIPKALMSTSSVSSEPPGVLDDGIEATDLGDLAEEVWVMENIPEETIQEQDENEPGEETSESQNAGSTASKVENADAEEQEDGETLEVEQGDDDQVDFSFRKGLKKFGRSVRNRIRTLSHGSSSSRKGNTGYWISFQDGLQRVVLFTTSHRICSHVLEGNKMEQNYIELSLSLQAVGLSLVNDIKGLEIAYIGIPHSKPLWETEKRRNRWKPVSNELKEQLESVFSDDKSGIVEIPDTELNVDFSDKEQLVLIEKDGTRKTIRRSQFEGVFLELAMSKHTTSIQVKINEVQVDNQLPFTPNPTILYAYPTPPSIASKFSPKPFIESSIIIRNTEQSNTNELQFLQVLIQEMGVSVDMTFILAITGLLADLPSGLSEAELIEKDISYTELPLEKSKVAQVSAAAARNYFKYLHLSPLDIHVSFSLDRDPSMEDEHNEASSSNPIFRMIFNLLNNFASLVGRTKDAELKLGYFQLENVALTQSELTDRITKHYTQQGLLQLYRIVLGLEVLGNPVGFIKGLKDGAVGLFYHPIQGAVLGPGEFFEGLGLGGQLLLEGTVGGVTGVFGKVSGVLGDTAARLTFDPEYQEERRRSGGKKTLTGTIGQGAEGVAKGVFHGVTGVFTQPIKGAKREGFWGVVKGVGRGAVGLVLRPTAGLLDFASATLIAVQKKTQIGDTEVTQIRTARYIGPEKIIYPYSPHLATGYALFVGYENGQLTNTDTFFGHMELVEDPLKVLLVTSKRFALIKYNSILDKFDDDMLIKMEELNDVTTAHENAINMPVVEDSLLGFGLIGKKKVVNKTLKVRTPQLARESVRLINQAYEEYRATLSLAKQ